MKRVLILGTGSAAIQIAVNLKTKLDCSVGIAGRISARSKIFFSELNENNNRVCVHIQNNEHISMSGECFIDHAFAGYETISEEWDTIIVSVTNNAYISVIKQLDLEFMKRVQCVVLVSPIMGSNHLVSHFLKQSGCSAEVVSFSTYYAATKGRDSATEVLTKAVKKKIYIGSTDKNSEACSQLSNVLNQLGIAVVLTKSPYEAESRNISIYVHSPIFMNECALDNIFGEDNNPKYAYKFYPEGPITQYVMHDILEQWKEISLILNTLEVERFNLLEFMNDDNYPVSPQSLSRDDIENFTSFDAIKQEYLLYIRYASLLIDPFSTPDANGKYFDFSAVPIQKVYQDPEGYWCIPRVPNEDYYRLKILQGTARNLTLLTPTIDKLIKNYERKLEQFAQTNQEYLLSDDFIPKCWDEEVSLICNEIRSARQLN
ncbi:opine metallophore biosynthesis dehydrogenase [Paenibacillus sp. DS2015]|uniref:opine metallophore biosynthesis dehydrogenase n=1 Tax=Paenibacillus sp. DS2015 TaxID=3373917 RepID=UPI003D1C49E8